jgi:uncharacterized membrane protein YecN with MAPEG domain
MPLEERAMHIVLFYAALLALLFVALSIRTLRLRRRLGIAIGDAGSEAMLRAMRAHANFAEYAPLSLLLLFFVESSGAAPLFVHALGAGMLLGRLSHAFGVSRVRENFAFRVAGMALTLTPMIASALYLLRVYASPSPT